MSERQRARAKTMEIPSEIEAPCLDKFQREANICLNTFPEKVIDLNNLIDEYAPEAIKKSQRNASRNPATSCLSVNSTTRDYYLHDGSSCSLTTWDRCKSRSVIRKRKYRLGYGGSTLRRRSRPLAHILAILVNRIALCTQAVLIRPSRYIIESVAAMLLQREQVKHVQCSTSTVNWSELGSGNSAIIARLICVMRPAAVRLIADTTILKRWLQAFALVSKPTNQSLAQAIRTTETIDGWGYELFFYLKYLQVLNFPCESDGGKEEAMRKCSEVKNTRGAESGNLIFPDLNLDLNLTDDVMHTNLWHRVVQLRDHYVILYETLSNSNQFLESDAPK